jgi:hypothetical protein
MTDISAFNIDDDFSILSDESLIALKVAADGGDENAQGILGAVHSWVDRYSGDIKPQCIQCQGTMLDRPESVGAITLTFLDEATIVSVFCSDCTTKHERRRKEAMARFVRGKIRTRNFADEYAKALEARKAQRAINNLPLLPAAEA